MTEPESWILQVYPALIATVRKRTGFDSVQALDLVHDAILEIYGSLERYDPEKGTFKAWSTGILMNLIRRHFEGRGRRETLSPGDVLDARGDPESESELTSAIVREITGVINRTLESVPPLYRDVMRLRFHDSRPLKDISKKMDLPLGTVKARLSRASDILKEALNFQQTTVRTYLDGHTHQR